MAMEKLDVPHHFAICNTLWTNETVKHLNREVIPTFSAVLDTAPHRRGAVGPVHGVSLADIGSTLFQLTMGIRFGGATAMIDRPYTKKVFSQSQLMQELLVAWCVIRQEVGLWREVLEGVRH